MREINLREKQLLELEILKYIISICSKHNLKYALNYGSMLGAVRHKGFIPWDGDLDIGLLREDYDKFINIMQADDKYNLFSYDEDEGNVITFFYNSVKIVDKNTLIKSNDNALKYDQLGVYIDVYAYDGLPNNSILRKIFVKIFNILSLVRKVSSWSSIPKEGITRLKIIKRSILFYICIAIGAKRAMRLNNKMTKMYKLKDSLYCKALSVDKYGTKDIMPKDIMSSYAYYDFEGEIVCGIKSYNYYLTKIYGEYMVEKREFYDEKVYIKD